MGYQIVVMDPTNLTVAKEDAINMNLHAKTVDVLRKGWNVMELTIVETARTRDIVKIVLSSIYTREVGS